jgi:hypothetical protein
MIMPAMSMARTTARQLSRIESTGANDSLNRSAAAPESIPWAHRRERNKMIVAEDYFLC